MTVADGAGSTTTGTQAVDRAAGLIAMVVKADAPVSFLDLVHECGLAKSTASRLLAALERSELLERDAHGGYVAGPLFWLYATHHDPWEELVRLARPTMELIGADTGETVNLSVVRGERVVQVAQVDTTYLLGALDWTEADVPAHVSALGKVLLAHETLQLEPGAVDQLTPRTIVDPGALTLELAAVVRRGWASTVDELEIGLTGVAVPVRGGDGQVVAALGISGPTQRLERRIDQIGRQLAERAEQLSKRLRREIPQRGVA